VVINKEVLIAGRTFIEHSYDLVFRSLPKITQKISRILNNHSSILTVDSTTIMIAMTNKTFSLEEVVVNLFFTFFIENTMTKALNILLIETTK
jgi:predicted transcriptional regulator YheO